MGLLNSVIGALGGQRDAGAGHGDGLRAVAAILSQGGQTHGGLSGLLRQFERGGLGELVESWVGTGHNLPVSAQQLERVFGGERIETLSRQLGMSAVDAARQLAQCLPRVIDRMTPQGRLPEPGAAGTGDLGDIDTLLMRMTRH